MMLSSLTTLLQLALSLLLVVQTSTSPPALQQKAISTVTQAIQLVTEAMQVAPSPSSSLSTYQNSQYSFMFQYPSTDVLSPSTTTSALFSIEEAAGVSNSPGDKMVVLVVLPSSTNANWTYLRDIEVWRDDTASGTASCLTQYPSSAVDSAVNFPPTKSVNGSDWIFNSGDTDNMTTETGVYTYSTLHDGSCYTIQYDSTESPNDIGSDDTSPTNIKSLSSSQSDEKQNQNAFLQALNTFTFSN
jgi:hypothetical protein